MRREVPREQDEVHIWMAPANVPRDGVKGPGGDVAVVVAEEGGRAERVARGRLPLLAKAANGLVADGVGTDLRRYHRTRFPTQ